MQVCNGPTKVGEVTLLSTRFGLTVIVEHDSEEAEGRDIERCCLPVPPIG
jgi:hypothetical protein